MSRVFDMAGLRIGRLLVLRRAGSDGRGLATWECACDCGSTGIVRGADLRSRHTTSCGCLFNERRRTASITHGRSRGDQSGSGYWQWRGMIQRCKPEGDPNYGGRGIRVCERWHGFENFLFDMGPRPPGMTIERIDNDGNYEPGNCRWATQKEQAANTRRNVFVDHDGERLHLSEWSRRTGLCASTIAYRLRRGLPPSAALSPRRRKNQFDCPSQPSAIART